MRFAWVVLAKLRYHSLRELLMMEILIRVMRKIINEEVKCKSVVVITGQQEGGEQYF